MKYNVGDKVRIKSLDWYNENKDEDGIVELSTHVFTPEMSQFCGKVVTIEDVFEDIDDNVVYYIKEIDYDWTDEMIEGLVEEEAKPKFKVGDRVEVLKTGNTYTISEMMFNGKEFVYTLSTTDNSVCWFSEEELKPIHFIDIAIKPHNVRGDEIIKMLEELGGTNAFSFDGSDHNCVNPFAYYIDNDDKQIYGGGIEFLRKNGYKIHALEELKKKEYPKTYEECCYVLGFENTELVFEDDYRDINPPKEQWKRLGLMNQLNKLLICRDAYWKIAGEEMGLGISWKPDYTDPDQDRYAIVNFMENIEKSKWDYGYSITFVFPTEEMRDEFKKNFDPDIEFCKEFL